MIGYDRVFTVHATINADANVEASPILSIRRKISANRLQKIKIDITLSNDGLMYD